MIKQRDREFLKRVGGSAENSPRHSWDGLDCVLFRTPPHFVLPIADSTENSYPVIRDLSHDPHSRKNYFRHVDVRAAAK